MSIDATSRVVWIKCEICGLASPQHLMKQLHNFQNLCGICFKKESEIAEQMKPAQEMKYEPAPFAPLATNPYQNALNAKIEEFNAEVIRGLVDQFVIGTNGIASREAYFNAEKTEIGIIEQTLKDAGIGEKDLHFTLAKIVRARLDAWAQIFFEPIARKDADQVALNELASKLRTDQKESLKIRDINYHPVAPVLRKPKDQSDKTKSPRMSGDDKAILSMAKSLFGKQIKTGQMTQEQAVERVRESIRGARAQVFEQIATGERKISELPQPEKKDESK